MLYARSVPPRYFTPQEANALVPTIRAYLLKAREHGLALLDVERALDEAGTPEERAFFEAQRETRAVAQAHLLDRIESLGAQLIDPLELGRVRFPALRNGEPVWLIWNLGEPRVERWAPIVGQVFGRRHAPSPTDVRWEWRN